MAEICEKCGKMIKDDFDKFVIEGDSDENIYFHSKCFDFEEFYKE